MLRLIGSVLGNAAGLLATQVVNAQGAVQSLPGGPAVNQLDLHPPASQMAADIQWLHNVVMLICVFIFIAVFGVMFYSILKHRKSVGHKAANFHESVAVEIAWLATVVTELVAPANEHWNELAIVRYPDFAAFRRIVESARYELEAAPHRRAALEDWRLFATVKLG